MQKLARIIFRWYRKVRLATTIRKIGWKKVPQGFWMKLNLNELVDQDIFFGRYERALVHCINRLVSPGQVCIDIGAHKGFFTLLFAQKVGPSGKVFAFEPDFRAVNYLQENVNRNNFTSIVKLYQIALGDRDDVCDIYLTSHLGNTSLFPNKYAAEQVSQKYVVRMQRLDSILNQVELPSDVLFVKIDAEGSELLILKGMELTIKKFYPIIWLEINRPSLLAGGFSDTQIEKFLRENNYQIYRFTYYFDKFLRIRFLLVPINSFSEGNNEIFDILAYPLEKLDQQKSLEEILL